MLHKKKTYNYKQKNSTISRESWRVNGVLNKYYVKCGKPNCRCQSGNKHGWYWYLTYREGSTLKRRYVKRKDLDVIRASLKRGHQFRQQKQQEYDGIVIGFELAKMIREDLKRGKTDYFTSELLQDSAQAIRKALEADKLTNCGSRYLIQPDHLLSLEVIKWWFKDHEL